MNVWKQGFDALYLFLTHNFIIFKMTFGSFYLGCRPGFSGAEQFSSFISETAAAARGHDTNGPTNQ